MSQEHSEILTITDKVADLVHKLAGPMADEIGQMLGDKVRVYRVRNWINTVRKTERMLQDGGLDAKAVPPRLLLPIMEGSSIEEDESLQELWAGLLATSSQDTDVVSPSFVETLRQLTPDEARHLERVLEGVERVQGQKPTQSTPITPYAFTERWGAPRNVTSEIYERLGIIRRDFDVKMIDTAFHSSTTLEDALDALENRKPELRYQFVFTRYGIHFMRACHGPDGKQSPANS